MTLLSGFIRLVLLLAVLASCVVVAACGSTKTGSSSAGTATAQAKAEVQKIEADPAVAAKKAKLKKDFYRCLSQTKVTHLLHKSGRAAFVDCMGLKGESAVATNGLQATVKKDGLPYSKPKIEQFANDYATLVAERTRA